MPSMCGPSSRSAWLNRPASNGLSRLTAATRRSYVGSGLLLASTLAACATVTPPAPVTPSVLQEAPPSGGFRMRLENFFGEKLTEPTN